MFGIVSKTFVLAFFFVLAACDPKWQPVQPDASLSLDNGVCGASRYQDLVGQPGAALEQVLIMQEIRVIRPGTAVTLDYRPTRLNVEIDANDHIARIVCG